MKRRLQFAGSRCVPTVEEELLYLQGGFGQLYCLERASREIAWMVDLELDADGRPCTIFSVQRDGRDLPRGKGGFDHRYHYARWDGDQWLDREIVAAGNWFPQTPEGEEEREVHYSGGVVLDHGNPSVVFLARPVDGVFEIEQWVTEDLGETWRSRSITQGSSRDNVRPFVVLNSTPDRLPNLLWMNNERYVHYTDYRTSIRMNLPSNR